MADDVLNSLLNGELSCRVIIDALSSKNSIKLKENAVVPISEFIPHFMAFLRARLLQNNDRKTGRSAPYFSPRQKEEQRKAERIKIKNQTKTATPGKSARLSLQYSSSPLKPITTTDGNNKNNGPNSFDQSETEINGISPIKTTETVKQSDNHKRGRSRQSRRFNKTVPATKFELNSMDDFPSMSSNNRTKTSKNPRRITATTVGTLSTPNNTSRTTTTKDELNGTTTNTIITSQQEFTTNASTLSSAAFLEESTFESQNADSSLFDSFFQGDISRFNNTNNNNTKESHNIMLNNDMNLLSLNKNKNEAITTPTKQHTIETLDIGRIKEQQILDDLSEIYTFVCLWNMVPNITLELFFLFTVLTARISSSSSSTQNSDEEQFLHPFHSIESYIYFAVKCIDKLRNLVVILDHKALTLLFENTRLQHFTSPNLLEYLEQEISLDESFNLSNTNQNYFKNAIKSPITGIAFQTDSDNRKSFLSDRHFYSFSKKRDAFYSIVRQWEDNISDPEWNMTQFLTKKVGDFMKQQDGLNNDLQFARLFIAQLLEMYKNEDCDKTEDASDTSDGVLKELKKRDPLRFQSLQNRLTGPSSTSDPCPKLTFSKVEEFFKEFVRIADSYSFNTCLMHEFLLRIQSQDANTFGLNQQISTELNKSDFSETLWHDVKTAIGELRLCAKFLGYILFLPYHALSSNKKETSGSRLLLTESLDLKGFLENATKKHRLLITLPWTVDLLSMADKAAFDLPSYKEPLHFLFRLYRQLGTKMSSLSSGGFLLDLTLTLHIGWMFDQNPAENFDFYESVFNDSTTPYEVKTLCNSMSRNGVTSHNMTPCDVTIEDDGIVVGLDDIVVVDKSYVYMICPYLRVIKKPLSDFKKKVGLDNNTGTFRKITPVRSTDVLTISAKAKLKNQLLDGFLKYAPNHVKDCINYVTDRFFTNLKHFISESIFLECQNEAIEEIKKHFVVTHVNDEEISKDSLKKTNQNLFVDCMEHSLCETKRRCQEYIKNYLSNTTQVTMKCLLPPDTNLKMLEVSPKVVRHNVSCKIQEWLSTNRELYVGGFESLYNRHLNHVIKMNKEENLFNFDDTF